MRTTILALLLMLAATAASGGPVTYTYDAAGRLVKADYGQNHSIVYTYDANGNLLSRLVRGPCLISCEASAAPNAGDAPLAVAFTATAAGTDCSGVATFAWVFGDGESSSQEDPTHTYAAPGVYSWSLAVAWDGQTCSRTGTVTVVPPCALTCSASADPAEGKVPLTVQFTSAAVTTNCIGGASFSWNFGDGATSTLQNPVHEYALAGAFTWTLTAGVDGKSCVQTGAVTAQPSLPGDCDGDGTTTIGEVQKAVNMFLGTLAPSCGVDCNGDGTISIGEVQKVINAFLGMTAAC
jgi:YD repeat-containing protein